VHSAGAAGNYGARARRGGSGQLSAAGPGWQHGHAGRAAVAGHARVAQSGRLDLRDARPEHILVPDRRAGPATPCITRSADTPGQPDAGWEQQPRRLAAGDHPGLGRRPPRPTG